jgi:hypothetical protein
VSDTDNLAHYSRMFEHCRNRRQEFVEGLLGKLTKWVAVMLAKAQELSRLA